MSLSDRLWCLYLSRFSKPSGDRRLYRLIRKRRLRRIVELGIGDLNRTRRLVRLAGLTGEPVTYAGLDPFEMRDVAAPLSLKQTWRALRPSGAQIRLAPGPLSKTLPQTANDLLGAELLLISAETDQASLSGAWFYVPRILAPDSLVLIERRENDGARHWSPLSVDDIRRLAGAGRKAA